MHIYDLFLDVNENELDDIAVQAFTNWNKYLKEIDPSFRVEKYEDYGPTITFYKNRAS